MRFAGTRIADFAQTPGVESFMDSQRPDMGEISMAGDNLRANENVKATDLMGQTTAKGISSAGEVEASGILAEAGAAYAQAQGNAAIMEGIGGIASSAIGAIPKMGGGGGGGGDIGSGVGNTSWGDLSSPSYLQLSQKVPASFSFIN
jgi:hypothetical protein